ncbi:putative aminopeptidase W07G4.4 isoform X2 [Pectinophora gossypiella]|uniref:putative aminopeptidase W07G4.4 isoform X2 n=1 Tax=Pectinophora gossypiella TaxID=13191 RepID=UPI00214F063E|nr:putative aminopeptidase W07G4.4 isoform X2 [Pectinophora gossypiella]
MGEKYVVNGVSVETVDEVCGAEWEALVLVTAEGLPTLHVLEDFVAAHHELDPPSKQRGCVSVVRCSRVCGARLVLSAAGELGPYDDVRSLGEAMRAGVGRAAALGAGRVVVALQPHPRFPRAPLVMLLAALEALYVPLQIRESFPWRAHGVSALGVYAERLEAGGLLRRGAALEAGRALARDVGGADPERMAPLQCARHIAAALRAGPVAVRLLDDAAELRRRYPLLSAVSRAADTVPHHRGCVVFLEYEPAEYDRTLMFVGKGVTYDTGGCDIKAGGNMAGMSRDKCGAAAIAGFFKACEALQPRVKAVASLGFVRNSVGAAAYVADELLTSARGDAVRVGNTDAEGRLVMADLLAELAADAASQRAAHVYSVATLTGHALRAVGAGYSVVLDNHVARAAGHAHKLQQAGDAVGDMIEVSTIRREDLWFHAGRAAGDSLHQADSRASVQLPRGHQGPAGFLLLAAGLAAGGVAYSHVDVAASAGCFPAAPTAAPLLALASLAGLLDA